MLTLHGFRHPRKANPKLLTKSKRNNGIIIIDIYLIEHLFSKKRYNDSNTCVACNLESNRDQDQIASILATKLHRGFKLTLIYRILQINYPGIEQCNWGNSAKISKHSKLIWMVTKTNTKQPMHFTFVLERIINCQFSLCLWFYHVYPSLVFRNTCTIVLKSLLQQAKKIYK